MFNKNNNNNNNNFSHLCRDWWSARLCQRRACAGRLSSRLHGGLLPTVFTAATDCVRGGLLCRLCSRRPLADCVHGGNQPTVFAAASCADCVHGGVWPTVFTAATSRLCSRRPLVPTVFTAASGRLCSRRQPADCDRGGFSDCVRSRRIHADCVHGGNQPTVSAAVSCADCVHGGLLPTVFTAAGRSIDTVVDKFLALMRRLSALWCLLKRDRVVLFLCRSLNVSVFTLVTEWFVFVVKGSKQFKGVFFRSHGCKHFVSVFYAVGILVQVQGRAGQPTS